MNLYVFVGGKYRQVRTCWVWLFKLLHIGVELPDRDTALREMLEIMELYDRKCQAYLSAH